MAVRSTSQAATRRKLRKLLSLHKAKIREQAAIIRDDSMVLDAAYLQDDYREIGKCLDDIETEIEKLKGLLK